MTIKDDNAPQDIGSPANTHYYLYSHPQKLFTDPTPPPPSIVDFELAEQTTGVFDNVIHNDTAAPNQVVVTVV